MKNLVIIEDETFAAEHLKRLLLEALPGSRVVAVMQSIEEAVEYFEGIDAAKVSGELAPDLAFVDIHLADGSAFRIFDRVVVPCPVVFTTAYDQYALDAFQAGGIDYLLKPIDKEALNRTIGKIRSLGALGQGTLAQQLAKAMRQPRSRILIAQGERLIPVDTENIEYIYLEDRVSHIRLADGMHYSMAEPLDAMMEQLDERLFFRANRQYIVSRNAIKEINLRPFTRLAIQLRCSTPTPIVLSRGRSQEFKQWYTQ